MIGLGFGAEFIPIYQNHPHANVYAICQRNEVELDKVGDQFGIDRRYTNYEDVLADPGVDFVHFNSPIPDHACLSLAVLKDTDITTHIWRFLYDVARQYRESFDVYGTKKSFEWIG